ncbi:MAG: hypothetical protein US40_C0013G0004 [Candidatus Roizmanbacteria bacterium GW2011_GWC2_37_13]|uniref:Uncharacterized protein n=1 Tax=Candidatus Roizmanbacteria bacterium GW2011_GWC2_37_13 TaxID=1618486 RepID=A0A0G0G4A4_9BACT|nr:MAG: hypothetical protein US38_C0014G0006 [Candidatus Roizmanbacteria bacterium GW2011_GWC1_37_12]KKQ24872.1 MAG: hypothetical protein US40_C0013G0004 [Candidatus Roizmanbacteria bacterium GW2011_GWC2_37_13]
MISLAVLYFYLSRNVRAIHESLLQSRIYHLGSIILSIITIIFYFQPFKNVALPQNLAFLKNPGFTPVGSQLDLAILLGFFIIIGIVNILKKGEKTSPLRSIIYHLGSIILPLTALFLTIYSLIKPVGTDVINHVSTLILPPFRLSWFAALEILKNPASAIIGIGPDNFSAIFTRVKDFAYNQSPLWQINSFNVSRSAILQILTETGIFGLLTFGLLIFNAIKQLVKGDHKGSPLQLFLFLYLIICLLIFPPSLILWFLFFILIAELSKIYNLGSNINKQIIDLSDLLPICVGIVIISLGLIGASGYFLGRTYASEYFFKKSIDGIALNNAKLVYDNQRQAIILNPYIERFRSSFAQTNILIANNLALKNKDGKITEQDRQTITQAIQAGISEGKVVVSLNPQKAGNWQSLASIYANIINAAAGADVWTISAFQRAILADPQNPVYRVSLGGVYYSQNKYDDALRFFEQAISLKPDWPNASYNYAWANFQKKNYPQAVNALQATIKLIDPKLNKADYDKALKELEEFKKMLPNEDVQVDQSGEKNQSGSLNLPTPPTTQISPKLELPKEASPEAK